MRSFRAQLQTCNLHHVRSFGGATFLSPQPLFAGDKNVASPNGLQGPLPLPFWTSLETMNLSAAGLLPAKRGRRSFRPGAGSELSCTGRRAGEVLPLKRETGLLNHVVKPAGLGWRAVATG